jgi:esterase/lipase superfamily enzyme
LYCQAERFRVEAKKKSLAVTRRHSILRSDAGACVVALQLAVAAAVFGQTPLPTPERPPVRPRVVAGSAEQTLARARAEFAAGDWAGAYADFRAALKATPIGSSQHDQALRGLSETGIKLAQERLSAGRREEARRIAREVLSERPNYAPALELIRQTETPSPAKRKISAKKKTAAEPSAAASPSQKTVTTSAPSRALNAEEPRRAPPPPRMSSEVRPPPGPYLRREMPASAAAPAAPNATAGVQVKQPLVKVYFATDRLPSGAGGPSKYFGVEWNKDGDHLFTGYVTVSIPPPHKEGNVERPFKFWIIQLSEDPKKHFVLTELKPVEGNDFYEMLRNEYAQRPREKRSALVFIHGFNVTFDDAAYRTAQLAYDLDFDGVPMMYSWPSQGRLLGYDGDSETVDWSSPHLQSFLERVAKESGALRIHLVAHSMGNQLLANALKELGRQPDIQPLFDNVIMAAPDVNAYTFTDQIWPALKKAAKRFTLYTSSDDEALKVSKNSKGPNDFYRLGEGGPKIVVISGLDTVDASGIDTSLLGHSYIDSCKPVMDDLQLIVQKGLAPLQRKLHDHYKEGLAYWTFR